MKYWLLSLLLISGMCVAEDIHCPAGTTFITESSPQVSEQWCEIIRNGKTVMHGPYQARWTNGQLGTSGRYEFGEQNGTWQEWDEAGVLQDTSVFEKGKQVN